MKVSSLTTSYLNSFVCLLACLLMFVSSGDEQPVAHDHVLVNTMIPEESIRLRIIPHSNADEDQRLKLEMRDVMIAQMNVWAVDLKNIAEARAKLNRSLDALQKLAEQTVSRRGFQYPVEIEVGQVQFPDKTYGQHEYPAGEYEGLVVTIGDGAGENWWCVLFPALCFVESGVDVDNVQQTTDDNDTRTAIDDKLDASDNKFNASGGKLDASDDHLDVNADQHNASNAESQAEVKFFIVEIFEKFISLFKKSE